jgi:hypothetical protein
MVAALGAFTETEMAQRVEDLREVGVPSWSFPRPAKPGTRWTCAWAR